MLGELQALRLVVGAEAGAVEDRGALGHRLVDEAANGLAMFEDEGHLVAAHFQHRPAAGTAGGGMAEAGIEEAGIMDAELADQRIEGDHLGRMRRLYAKRREAFHELCNACLGDWLQPVASDSGIQSLWLLADGHNDRDIEEAARKRSVVVTALSSHYRHSSPRNGLIFGYTALDEKTMKTELNQMRCTFIDMESRASASSRN